MAGPQLVTLSCWRNTRTSQTPTKQWSSTKLVKTRRAEADAEAVDGGTWQEAPQRCLGTSAGACGRSHVRAADRALPVA